MTTMTTTHNTEVRGVGEQERELTEDECARISGGGDGINDPWCGTPTGPWRPPLANGFAFAPLARAANP